MMTLRSLLLLLTASWMAMTGLSAESSTSLVPFPSEDTLRIDPGDDNVIYYSGVAPAWISPGVKILQSDVPVTFLTADPSGFPDTVVDEGDGIDYSNAFFVIVKGPANCTGSSPEVNVTWNVDESTYEETLVIQTGGGLLSPSFLSPSSFEALWKCAQAPSTAGARSRSAMSATWVLIAMTTMVLSLVSLGGNHSGGGPRSTALLVLSGLAAVSAVMMASSNASPSSSYSSTMTTTTTGAESGRRQLQETCEVNVEILYRYTCFSGDFTAEAPAIRQVALSGDAATFDDVTGTCQATQAATAASVADSLLSAKVGGEPWHGDPCALGGRPFRDAKGTIQVAEAMDRSDLASVWSAPSRPRPEISSSNMLMPSNIRNELGAEWKRRAVGEHASIASFAAFTIALMSNQAPPDLIRDSLNAAMDEFRHATVSFEMTSLLLGKTIEPGPLPSSQQEFGNNLTALALGVAIEGCIEETLSALVLAASMDQTNHLEEDDKDALWTMLQETTSQIAQEEGNHAILAWRTIHWVCSNTIIDDTEACAEVQKDVLNLKHLEKVIGSRFTGVGGDDSIAMAWEFIYKNLLPLVTRSDANALLATTVTNHHHLDSQDSSKVHTLALAIVEGVRVAVSSNHAGVGLVEEGSRME